MSANPCSAPFGRTCLLAGFLSAGLHAAAAAPSIEFTSVPPYGSSANLSGRVLAAAPAAHRVVVFIYVPGAGWWSKPYCDRPLTIFQSDGRWTTDITTGGSDAVEVALKIARAATGRFKTLSFWDAFHGAGFGASSVGGEATFRSHVAGPLLPGAEHVAPFHCYHCAYGHPGPEACALACAKMVDYVLGREGDIAAVIAEPMRAVPVVPPPGFWAAVRAACDRHGALLILDEIPTGLGKTGRMFGFEHDGVQPDIVVLGKALGGAMLPLAAVVARPGLDVAGDFAIGHYTHEKNPVTTRAGLTTLRIIAEEGLVDRSAELGRRAMGRLREAIGTSPVVGDIRGRGLMFGVEIVADRAERLPDPDRAERIYYRCLAEGLSFKISAGNVLTLSPPLVIAEQDLDRAMDIVAAAVRAEA